MIDVKPKEQEKNTVSNQVSKAKAGGAADNTIFS